MVNILLQLVTKFFCRRVKLKTFRKKHTKLNWQNFDNYERKIWYIVPCETNWKLGKCSCPINIKNFMCKHLIAISATLRLEGCVIPKLPSFQLVSHGTIYQILLSSIAKLSKFCQLCFVCRSQKVLTSLSKRRILSITPVIDYIKSVLKVIGYFNRLL